MTILSRKFLLSEMMVLVYLALLKLTLHFATNHDLLGYGYFRDEFYYLINAERPDFGYVDHPPVAPLLLGLNRFLFGDSIFALRLLPAIAGATTVFLTGWMARELGGGRFAQGLAALAVIVAPIHLILNSFFSMNAFEVLSWTACAYLLILLLKTEQPKWWLWIGLLAGVSLQTKHTFVLFGLGMVIGLICTSNRKYLRSPWLWRGGIIAFLLFSPNLLWQVAYGWPSLEFYANASFYKNIPTGPLSILIDQMLVMHPLTLPIWLAGLFYFFFTADGKRFRLLGWLYLTLLALMLISQSSRPDRIAGAYPMLLAGGALLIERSLPHHNRGGFARAIIAILIVGGLFLLPLSLSILPPDATDRFNTTLGLVGDIEEGKSTALPQYLADRFGWESLVETVAEVHAKLPLNDQTEVAIFTKNYGEAGAVDFYGSRYNLPKAISGHNNYYLWGPGETTGDVIIAIGFSQAELDAIFEEVTLATTFSCEYCVENGTEIYLARNIRVPVQEAWSQAKHYE